MCLSLYNQIFTWIDFDVELLLNCSHKISKVYTKLFGLDI